MNARIALAYAGFILIGLTGGISGVVLPAQISYYGVDKATIGLTFITFSAGYVSSGAAAGWLIHRLGMRATLMTAMSVLFAATVLTGVRPPFVLLVALQVIYGFGVGAVDTTLNAYLAGLPNAPTLLNFLHACYGLGALVGPIAAAALLTHVSWNVIFLLIAGLCVPLGVAFRRAYPRQRTAPDVAAAADAARPATAPRPLLSMVLRQRGIWLGAVFLCLYVGIEITFGNWGYSFLTEERGQDEIAAGWVISGLWLGLTIGRFLLGGAARRLGPVGLTTLSLTGIAASILWVWVLPGAVLASVGLVALGVFLGPVFPTLIALVQRLTSAHLVPTAVGVLVGVSVIGGALLPWLAGAIAQRAGLGALMPYALLLAALLGVCWWRLIPRLAPVGSAGPIGSAGPVGADASVDVIVKVPDGPGARPTVDEVG